MRVQDRTGLDRAITAFFDLKADVAHRTPRLTDLGARERAAMRAAAVAVSAEVIEEWQIVADSYLRGDASLDDIDELREAWVLMLDAACRQGIEQAFMASQMEGLGDA